MPFKSQAQRRKFAELLVKGEISEKTFEEWNRETGSAKLPEYVSSRARRGSNSKRRPTSKVKTARKANSKSRTKTETKRR